MFSRILEIKNIRELKAGLSKREAELIQPTLTDINLVGKLYEWYKEILTTQGSEWKDNILRRKKFIFIVLYLYCPEALAGGRMKYRLREKIAEALSINRNNSISNDLNNIVFSYQVYKDYRQDVDNIYGEIVRRLKMEGYINEQSEK